MIKNIRNIILFLPLAVSLSFAADAPVGGFFSFISPGRLLFPKAAEEGGEKAPVLIEGVVIVPSGTPDSVEERNDLSALKTSLSVSGIPLTALAAQDVSMGALKGFNLIVVPFAAARRLSPETRRAVEARVRDGAVVVLDGPSALAEEFGIGRESGPVTVSRLRDLRFPDIPLYWQKPVTVCPVAVSTGMRVVCVEEESRAPLAVRGGYGRGKYLFYSPLFDDAGPRGYSRFPFLYETVAELFGGAVAAERRTAGMYFDPGIRYGAQTEDLVQYWREHGVHRVYCGAWYPDYDYGKLIRLCHENGILVYAWLELPMVSIKFWDEHPEWREKTALLADAHVDWRYLMNLADPECRAAVFEQTAELLVAHEWDGVDIAELYFESANAPTDPRNFTPMNDLVRRDFKKACGFDPREIFEPNSRHYWKKDPGDWKKFAGYRKNLCNELKNGFLDLLSGVRENKKVFDIVITAIDASMAPQLEDAISEDTAFLLALQKKYGLTLQVEDEYLFWPGRPERYAALGEYYRAAVPEIPRLEIDLNVVDNHVNGEGGLPGVKPTGEEIRQIVYNMDLYRARPVFYAEDTLYPHDFGNINRTLAREARITPLSPHRWEVKSPYMVTLRTGRKGTVRIDGRPWGAGEGTDIIIPAGRHVLEFRSGPGEDKLLRYISSELTGAKFSGKAAEFTYDEPLSSCYAVLGRAPERIELDGKYAECAVYPSEGRFTVKLPGGRHAVRIQLH